MLQSSLDEIIEYYEAEKNNLEFLIQECVKEREYLMANYHFQAFRKVNGKLQTLYNLRDPLYESRSLLEQRKEAFQKQIDTMDEHLRRCYIDSIKEYSNRIEKLNKQRKPQTLDRQELHELLDALIPGTILRFKLNLIKESNLFIEFQRLKETIIISFPALSDMKEFTLHTDQIKVLHALGFHENKLTSRLEKHSIDFLTANVLNNLVAKILFDVFYYKLFDNPATIEIITS